MLTRVLNFREEPWGQGGARWKADVEIAGTAPGCLGRLVGASARPPRSGTVVRDADGHDWFWEESCRKVGVYLGNDLRDALDQHERRLESGKPGL